MEKETKNAVGCMENEHRRTMSEAGTPVMIGHGGFGDIYDWAGRDQREAFDFLMENESGDLLNVFYRDDIGGIDLVWGDENSGLCHIIDKHVGYSEDGKKRDFGTIKDATERILKVLKDGSLIQRREISYVVSDDGYRVAIRKDLNGEKKNWVITAVDYNRSTKEKGIAANHYSASHDAKGAELGASRNSKGKGSKENGNTKENGENLRFRDVEDDDVASEQREIIDRARKDGTLGKAPNGKPSRLAAVGGEELWARVRTPQFKSWFGDWEKAARIEKLRKSEPVEITGKEITPSENLNQYRRNAVDYGLKNLRGKYVNEDTRQVFEVVRRSIKETLRHDKYPAHIQSVAAIPQIIEKSIYIDTYPNEDREKNPDVDYFDYYVCGLKIGGDNYTVKAVIVTDLYGNKYYDHTLTEIEKGELISLVHRFSMPGGEKNHPLSGYKDIRLFSILQTNCSKILDENGEPLVVYHGSLGGEEKRTYNATTRDYTSDYTPFTVFKRWREGEKNKGFWFSSDSDVAFSFGGFSKYNVFLNMRNPLVIDCNRRSYADILFEGKLWDSYDLSEEAEKRGYDGMILKNISEGADLGLMEVNADDYVVYKSNQIKNIDNDNPTESPDIRFRDVEDEEPTRPSGPLRPGETIFDRAEAVSRDYIAELDRSREEALAKKSKEEREYIQTRTVQNRVNAVMERLKKENEGHKMDTELVQKAVKELIV